MFIYVISKIIFLKSKTWRCIKHGNVNQKNIAHKLETIFILTQKNIENFSYNKNKLQVDPTLALQHTFKLKDLILPINHISKSMELPKRLNFVSDHVLNFNYAKVFTYFTCSTIWIN